MPTKLKSTLKPFYRICELVRLTGTSRGRVLRMLQALAIEPVWIGGQRVFFVSDIRERMPRLWRSIVACEQARMVARTVSRIRD